MKLKNSSKGPGASWNEDTGASELRPGGALSASGTLSPKFNLSLPGVPFLQQAGAQGDMFRRWIRLARTVCCRTRRASSWQGPWARSGRAHEAVQVGPPAAPPDSDIPGLAAGKRPGGARSPEGEPAGGPMVSAAKPGWSPVGGKMGTMEPTRTLCGAPRGWAGTSGMRNSPPLRTRSLQGLERAAGDW